MVEIENEANITLLDTLPISEIEQTREKYPYFNQIQVQYAKAHRDELNHIAPLISNRRLLYQFLDNREETTAIANPTENKETPVIANLTESEPLPIKDITVDKVYHV
jgi:hypothetical protein